MSIYYLNFSDGFMGVFTCPNSSNYTLIMYSSLYIILLKNLRISLSLSYFYVFAKPSPPKKICLLFTIQNFVP